VVERLADLAPTWLARMPALLGPEPPAALIHRAAGTERMLREGCEAIEALAARRTLMSRRACSSSRRTGRPTSS
jgi:hypothetical protein